MLNYTTAQVFIVLSENSTLGAAKKGVDFKRNEFAVVFEGLVQNIPTKPVYIFSSVWRQLLEKTHETVSNAVHWMTELRVSKLPINIAIFFKFRVRFVQKYDYLRETITGLHNDWILKLRFIYFYDKYCSKQDYPRGW